MLRSNLPTVQGKYKKNAKMHSLTWIGVGGVAEVLFKPANTEDLASFMRAVNFRVHVLGTGANLIIRDGYLPGAVVKLGVEFAGLRCDGDKIIAGCATPIGELSTFARDCGISGFEFCIGIPGTIGGAIATNASAYGNSIAQMLQSVQAVNEFGEVCNITRDDLAYGDGGHGLEGTWIFTEATFVVTKADPATIKRLMSEFIIKRSMSQPVGEKVIGYIFKNHADQEAQDLISTAGCRGLKLRKAAVSEQHCNFFVNKGGATAKDLEDLGNEVRDKVKRAHGIGLEWSVEFWGDGR